MKKILLVRFFALGVIAAVVLSIFSTLCLNQISEMGARDHRRNFMLSLASSIEAHPLDEHSLSFFRPGPGPGGHGGPHPGPPPEGGPHGPPPEGGPPEGPPPFRFGPPRPPPSGRPTLWVVSSAGEVISATNTKELPFVWSELDKPQEVHEFTAHEDLLKIAPGVFIVKLADPAGSFLVLREERRHLNGPFFFIQIILLFATVCAAVFLALSITFYYLQRKSKEAKGVLLRMEKGDLKARFEIKAFDEFGNLLLDFNRMADQIEKLVVRVQETERTRKNLLQELGHDLRTPLTGLKTSFETLKFHWAQTTEQQREELFEIMGGEIEYLGDLLDKLMTISSLDEPHYRADTDEVDLEELVFQEVRAREGKRMADSSPHWKFIKGSAFEKGSFLADPHLILRMLRNALDNAGKYAEREVAVTLLETPTEAIIQIVDDGPGFSETSLQSFGHRLEHRVRKERGDKNFSLGLGSVIMKSIAELHGGTVAVSNRTKGAVVEIRLPKIVPAVSKK